MVAGSLGTTAVEAAEAGPVPTPLVAATLKVYGVFGTSPVTVKVVPAPPVLIGLCAVPLMDGVTT